MVDDVVQVVSSLIQIGVLSKFDNTAVIYIFTKQDVNDQPQAFTDFFPGFINNMLHWRFDYIAKHILYYWSIDTPIGP